MDLITYLNYKGKDKTWDEIGKQFNMSGEAARKRWLRHQMKETSPKLKLRSTWQVQTKEGVQWLESYRAEPEQIDFSAAIDKIQHLRGVSFDWKADGKHDIGLIAEEVGEVIPEVVVYEENGTDAKSLDYARLVAVLIEAVKEQQKQLDELRKIVQLQNE